MCNCQVGIILRTKTGKGCVLLDITFLPKKRSPRNIKPITYHVDEENNVIAVAKAKLVFKLEHKCYNYYDKVAISETRIL